ncbi:hypothetical protein [Amycolatopsis pithecellobii]|uniref:Uncharacterized protein n=1 Tax=Amycolatopsis pithecellobii TaxID=664692 RepID=A0A6N7Z3L7_9PSEU|nr:hypothetical protein [Amycolatopsis pithecellobii]MTD54851.1 hypothetical protein [Amycolatopsis pithecellobii]
MREHLFTVGSAAPLSALRDDLLFVDDGSVLTSAGSAAALDLSAFGV